ncbi:hypothetical protein HUU62_19175 [Rhodoferax sp. 4810]|nr:hypothetical protein [Rhodoferax jenense]
MLEPCVNQAAGLQSLALQQVPRLVAVTSHGQQQGEMPLLWGLCTSWVNMGLSVLVLDGHAAETQQNPGLAQLLTNPLSRQHEEDNPVSWAVIPAAEGLARLLENGFLASSVGELFKAYAVVLVYANADRMTQLLKGCALAPLLVVPPARKSAISAYKALKHLLVVGQLRPTVANIVPDSQTMMPMPPSSTAQNMMDCASYYLGYSIKPLTITASARADRSQEDITRLARQLLESAVPLERKPIERVH